MNKFPRSFILIVLLFGLPAACLAQAPGILLAPAPAQQGRCFAVQLVSAEGTGVPQGRFLGQALKFFRAGNDWQAIIGVPPEQKAGRYPLDLELPGGEQRSLRVKVARTSFPSVSFWLKPAKKKLFTRDLIAEEWARIEKVLLVEPAERAWHGRFSRPAQGPTSMLFGTVEKINNKRSGQHRGLDIAVPIGTKVAAANDGRVVFAEKLKAFGGTIVIDHGQGVQTLYFHLSKFLAEVGQQVVKGEIIALSGNTGISSGPHLHWGMSVHNLRVDPAQWTKYAF